MKEARSCGNCEHYIPFSGQSKGVKGDGNCGWWPINAFPFWVKEWASYVIEISDGDNCMAYKEKK